MESVESPVPLSGRRAQARRNDVRIREAAREVFTADPEAPMSAVAARARVGISALYLRYRNKEDLLRQVAQDGLQQYLDIAEVAAADDGEPWAVFVGLMEALLDAQTVAITMNLAGTFTPTEELYEMAARSGVLNEQIVQRVKESGDLREDVTQEDLSLILEQVSTIRLGTPERTRELRSRYLALILDGLRAKGTNPLPGAPPESMELASRWLPRP